MKSLVCSIILATASIAMAATPNDPGAAGGQYDFSFQPKQRQVEILDKALNGKGTFYFVEEFRSDNGNTNDCPLTIRYHRFGSKKGSRGAILISTGFTEAALKYTEFAEDMMARGFEPIYVINHRGQGSSDRVLVPESYDNCRIQRRKNKTDHPEPSMRHKGFVENFWHYISDFDKFVKTVVERDGPQGTKILDTQKMYLLAHSMGGAIAQGYLMNKANPFERVILSSPMMRPWLPDTSPIANTLVSRIGSNAMGTLGIHNFDDYAQKMVADEWRIEDRPFSLDHGFSGAPENKLTSDPDRFWFHINLLDQHPDDLPINGPTLGWVHEALDGTEGIISNGNWGHFSVVNFRNPYIKKSIKDLKIKIFQAGADVVVQNHRQDAVCDKINRFSAPTYNRCEMVKEPFYGAQHEIFIESDIYRDAALDIIDGFFIPSGEETGNQARYFGQPEVISRGSFQNYGGNFRYDTDSAGQYGGGTYQKRYVGGKAYDEE